MHVPGQPGYPDVWWWDPPPIWYYVLGTTEVALTPSSVRGSSLCATLIVCARPGTQDRYKAALSRLESDLLGSMADPRQPFPAVLRLPTLYTASPAAPYSLSRLWNITHNLLRPTNTQT